MIENVDTSIQKEIDLHRGDIPEVQWLTEIALIDTPSTPYSFGLIQDWHRPGSESYILDFEINTAEKDTRLIAKACIKMGPVQTVVEWHNRRQRVASAGIEVPKLYSTHRADYIEEYIPMELKAAYSIADAENRNKIENSFMDTYKKLVKLGFSVISLHDVRSRGDDVVLIDFGSDLGGFINSSTENKYTDKLAEAELGRIVRV
jgi:hypothetical protein